MTMHVGVGIMSGTSLDALDLCCVEFIGDEDADNWKYTVIESKTIPYTDAWRQRLLTAHRCTGEELIRLHLDYGHFVGEKVRQFMDEHPEIDDIKFISSHGHTIFHQPHTKLTFQLGDGETMASHLNVPVVTNFRTKDVALGGQGAPLVHVGERHLFSECNVFLNLGGISNVTVSGQAFDVVPCNIIFNHLARGLDPPCEFDEGGNIAESGTVICELLEELNRLEFYNQAPPKSLSREWFETEMLPILDKFKSRAGADVLRTAVEHVTDQIRRALVDHMADTSSEPVRLENTLLVTGGGALNSFLMSTLNRKLSTLPNPITTWDPEEDTIKYKEAIIFAFLGLRTLLGRVNIRSKDTGARSDTVSGSIHLPPSGNDLLPHLKKSCPFHIMRKISRASVNTFGSTEELGLPGGSSPEDQLTLSNKGTLYERCALPLPLRDRTLTH